MKPTPISSVLAALLLASLGSVLVAEPALAQQYRVAPGATAIERFTLRVDGRIDPGEEVRFRMVGTPGSEAWVDIPGVISGLDLKEARPGVYEGSYVVRRRDDRDAFARSVGTLRNGRQQVTAQVDMRDDRGGDWRGGNRDNRPPQVTGLVPADGARVPEDRHVLVAARVADEGSGIDPRSVRLRVGGRDVTGDSRLGSDGEIRYQADLRPGRYTADVSARDKAGNTIAKSWTFEVVARAAAPVPVPARPPVVVVPSPPPVAIPAPPVFSGPLNVVVTSHPNGGFVPMSENVKLEGQTVPGANVRVQVDTVVNQGDTAMVRVSDQTVQADGSGHFAVIFSPSGYVLPGVRYDVRVTSSVGNRAVEQRLALERRPG